VIAVVSALRKEPIAQDPDAILDLLVAPGRREYFRNLTDDQIKRLNGISHYGAPVTVGENLVFVVLVPRDVPVSAATFEIPVSEAVWARAEVRYFRHLQDWRVVRVGDIGPPELEVIK
jgi:hypothetical protein